MEDLNKQKPIEQSSPDVKINLNEIRFCPFMSSIYDGQILALPCNERCMFYDNIRFNCRILIAVKKIEYNEE